MQEAGTSRYVEVRLYIIMFIRPKGRRILLSVLARKARRNPVEQSRHVFSIPDYDSPCFYDHIHSWFS